VGRLHAGATLVTLSLVREARGAVISRTREARALEGYNHADSRSVGQPLVNLPRTVPVA